MRTDLHEPPVPGLGQRLHRLVEPDPLPQIPEGARIVCTVTGHGLKDPDVAREQCGGVIPAKAEKGEILRLIQG